MINITIIILIALKISHFLKFLLANHSYAIKGSISRALITFLVNLSCFLVLLQLTTVFDVACL